MYLFKMSHICIELSQWSFTVALNRSVPFRDRGFGVKQVSPIQRCSHCLFRAVAIGVNQSFPFRDVGIGVKQVSPMQGRTKSSKLNTVNNDENKEHNWAMHPINWCGRVSKLPPAKPDYSFNDDSHMTHNSPITNCPPFHSFPVHFYSMPAI